MGNYQFGLPIECYNLTDCEETFTRSGEEGTIPIFSPVGTDHFFGEVLEGHWIKGDDGVILGPITQLITGGELQITGRAAAAGNPDYGWITSKNLFYFYGGTIVDIHLQLPGHTAAQELWWKFLIVATNSGTTSEPENENDVLSFELYTDNTDYKIRVQKKVSGTWSDLTDVDGDGYEDVTDAEGTFRLRIHRGGRLSCYYHDGAGAVDEDDDEVVEEQDVGLNFDRGYVSYELVTEEAANRTVNSDSLTITYPENIQPTFIGPPAANQYQGDVEVWDGNPDTTGVRVYDTDHVFSGDCYIQNDLVRLRIKEGLWAGLQFLYYSGSWLSRMDRIRYQLTDDNIFLYYPYLRDIVMVSRDAAIVRFRLHEDAVDDTDYFLDVNVTIRRGMPQLLFQYERMHPIQPVEVMVFHSTTWRWGYGADAEVHGIGDDDNNLDADNTTMSENFMMAFDDASYLSLGFIASTTKPDSGSSQFKLSDGGDMLFDTLGVDNLLQSKHIIGHTHFSEVAELYTLATDNFDAGWENAAAKVGGNVDLDANNDEIWMEITAGTDLPAGRYVGLVYVSDTNAVANDLGLSFENQSDGEFRNQENEQADKTCPAASAWGFRQVIFDITDQDVSDTDTMEFSAEKITAGANTISIEYFLIVPIGNGEDWPQDLAHSLLRYGDQWFRVVGR